MVLTPEQESEFMYLESLFNRQIPSLWLSPIWGRAPNLIFNLIPPQVNSFTSGQRQSYFEETLVLLQPQMYPISLLIALSQKEPGE